MQIRRPNFISYRNCYKITTRGVATGMDIDIYTPKSAQVNFLWGKNNVRTAIQQFYTPPPKKKLLYPQTNFWLRP